MIPTQIRLTTISLSIRFAPPDFVVGAALVAAEIGHDQMLIVIRVMISTPYQNAVLAVPAAAQIVVFLVISKPPAPAPALAHRKARLVHGVLYALTGYVEIIRIFSMPTNVRLRFTQATPVVPLPMNGSKMLLQFLAKERVHSITAMGFCVG